MKEWYQVDNIDQVDTPALLVYPDRIKQNIDHLKSYVKDLSLLRPHVKTNKSAEVSRFLLAAGITKFKCATIAEAEMLGMCDAPDVLIAHQPVGLKAQRMVGLARVFSETKFSTIIDNAASAEALSDAFSSEGMSIPVYIDLNVGMNRSGVRPENAMAVYQQCQDLPGIRIVGLHAYDGHIRDSDLTARTKQCDEAFMPVLRLKNMVESSDSRQMTVVAGGTPTFPIHAKRGDVECSPGTFVYWDKGYETLLPEQKFVHAAVVATRVISKIDNETICVDLGHKAIAAENSLNSRVSFLNLQATPIGHSEEHLVLKIDKHSSIAVGDVIYGIPYHICPTVALHETAITVERNKATGTWTTISRKRKITI